MLKRFQAMLPDWLAEYINHASEMIRLEICFAVICATVYTYPNYKPKLTPDELLSDLKKMAPQKIEREQIHTLISKLYFEARKAVDFRLEKEKK